MSSGIERIVYGLKKASPSTVETEDGKLIRKPDPIFLSDCRACALLEVVCEELESPCTYLLEKCEKPTEKRDCEKCERLDECLCEKPCCWECGHLTECLEIAKDCGADQLVSGVFGYSWEEFVEAVKMLVAEEALK
jgi:hypothetical protein